VKGVATLEQPGGNPDEEDGDGHDDDEEEDVDGDNDDLSAIRIYWLLGFIGY